MPWNPINRINAILNAKNPTPREIAFYSALLVFVLFLAAGLITMLVFGKLMPWWVVFPLAAIVLLASYYVIEAALGRYIYRKIKLIYKTIHRLKVPNEQQSRDVDLTAHIMDEVEKEVREWAKSYRREIEELKSMEAYRRDFLGNISHELKTPIFNIQGYLHTLLDGGLEDKKINTQYLKKAVNNLDRLQTIIQDLEVISRLEAGELQLDYQVFDIKQLAREVIEDMEMKAAKRRISIRFKEGASQSYKVRADRENIRQVLINLASNSIKYGREGGLTQISFYDMDKNILVEIADNGIGIDARHLPRLFERFYRVDKSRSRSQGGTGLGLAIVKHIIEAHKQTVHVRSSVGMGSTFGFTLEKAR